MGAKNFFPGPPTFNLLPTPLILLQRVALLAMQSAVLATGILSVCPSRSGIVS